jgi:hypothetical protein
MKSLSERGSPKRTPTRFSDYKNRLDLNNFRYFWPQTATKKSTSFVVAPSLCLLAPRSGFSLCSPPWCLLSSSTRSSTSARSTSSATPATASSAWAYVICRDSTFAFVSIGFHVGTFAPLPVFGSLMAILHGPGIASVAFQELHALIHCVHADGFSLRVCVAPLARSVGFSRCSEIFMRS